MSGQSLSFGSNGVYDRIFLNTSGNVGIGTASPLVRLHLSQSASGTYGPVIFLSNSANTANDVTGIYGSPASGTALPYRGGITFAPGNTGRVRIHTGNNANPGDGICCTFDGANVSLNSANTAAIFDASGSQQGLKLPATPGNADTQTLDCYQENAVTTTGVTFTNITTSAGTINCQVNWTRVGRGMFLQLKLYPDAGQTLTVSANWQINLSAVAGFPTTMTQDAPMPLAAGNTATIAQATAFINASSRIVYGNNALTVAANVYYVLTAFIPY